MTPFKENRTKQVLCRHLPIGGGAPVSIQSMTNVDSCNGAVLLRQIQDLQQAGCDIVRIAIPSMEAAETLAKIRPETEMPLVADIHFDHRLALAAIAAGADKIRINPGNIGSLDRVRQVVDACREKQIPIRIGVNSGSLEKDLLERYGGVTAEGLAESALRNLAVVEDMGYDQLVVSLKSSDVVMNDRAYRLVAQQTDYPIHIGVTEAGTLAYGQIKSAVGLGALLLSGIGDTMRVSLTADPIHEVTYARKLLETVGLRQPPYTLVSCPTCGRTRIPLQELAEAVDARLAQATLPPGLKIAVMGCAVNGPGEAREADYGVAGGDGKGILFRKGEILETVAEDAIIDRLLALIEEDNR